ncbi:MAG: dipeptidyl aminopeptidase/acylaminoacyl peptidase [Polaribacter sp.]
MFIVYCVTLTPNAEAKRLPIESFAKQADMSSTRLAPNGERLAFIARFKSSDKNGYVVSVLDIATNERKNYGFTDNSKFQYYGVDWLNDITLRLRLEYPIQRRNTLSFETRMFKLNVETGVMDSLVPENLFSQGGRWAPTYYGYIVDNLESDQDHFLFATTTSESKGNEVYLISIKGDKPVLVQKGINYYHSWMTDQQSRVRLAESSNVRERNRIVVRDVDGNSFRTLWEFDADSNDEVVPMGFDFDPNVLYFSAKLDNRWVIYKADITDEKLTRTLVYDNPNDDVLGGIRYSRLGKRAIGVYKGAGQGFIFWDEEYKKLNRTLSKALPDLENNFYDFSRNEQQLLVYSSSDIESGSYYVWNRDTKRVELLAFRYKDLAPDQMSKQTYSSFTARDGVERPVTYTFPKNVQDSKPTIITLTREPDYVFYKSFSKRAQFLANRGYNVAQINLRDPKDKGEEYRESGIVGWGTDSIKDVVDLAKELSRSKAVNPDNICILGERYGAIIALVAAASDEFTFKCVVSIGGITDLRDFVRFKRK